MRCFSKHYREAHLALPDRFSRREYGFMFFDRGFVMRHLAFPTRATLKKYLVEQVPSHAYYSSAYYERPDAPTMAEKKWLGADLIFDLDADHVEGTKGLPYEEMLEHVKREVVVLIDEFLLGDMGFDAGHMKIVFSGGRGYHVHVRDPMVTKLSSHERREIVDYITGTALDMDWVFPATPFEAARFKERVGVAYKRAMPRLEDAGPRPAPRGDPPVGCRTGIGSCHDTGSRVGGGDLGLVAGIAGPIPRRRRADRLLRRDQREPCSGARIGAGRPRLPHVPPCPVATRHVGATPGP